MSAILNFKKGEFESAFQRVVRVGARSYTLSWIVG